jgi:CheB methylesterase
MMDSRHPAKKILVIGGSTHNPCTPSRIRDAFLETSFLEEWAIIFANHNYFRIQDTNNSISEFETGITHQFWGLNLVFIQALGNYKLARNWVYIIPDIIPTSLTLNSDCDDWTYTIAKRQDFIEIGVSSQEASLDDTYNTPVNLNPYSPNIDQVMTEVSHSYERGECTNIAGLLLCGKDDDGARGLLSIKQRGGHTAVQMPSECHHPNPKAINTNSAIALAKQQGISHESVFLENPHSSYTLTDWLCQIK